MEKETVKLTKLSKCAGCGAKVGAGVLAQLLQDIKVHSDPNLLVGFDHSDDASVYKISDELALVQTVDFFPPIADDPYLFGQIAATNALSDVYAMGGEPKLCLNIMAVPEKMPMDAVHDILRGGYDKVYEAGALITGGHSIHDDEPKYGLAVTGFVHPDRVLTNSGAKPGDVLFLTKPLGIGILSTAAKADMVSEEGQRRMFELMTTLNRSARDVMVKYDVHACTDVTGFGLHGRDRLRPDGAQLRDGTGQRLHPSPAGREHTVPSGGPGAGGHGADSRGRLPQSDFRGESGGAHRDRALRPGHAIRPPDLRRAADRLRPGRCRYDV